MVEVTAALAAAQASSADGRVPVGHALDGAIVDIVDSVINATNIPAQRADIIKRTSDKVRAHLVTRLPEGFLDATKDLPREWMVHSSRAYVDRNSCPAHILLSQPGQHMRHEYVDYEPLRHPGTSAPSIEEASVLLADLIVEATKLRAREDGTRSELINFLASCPTTEKAVERMPSIERHMPAPPVKTYAVLASTAPLTKALKSLGFDTGVKK